MAEYNATRAAIADRVRARREYLNLKQWEVAEQLGMNRNAYTQWEVGRSEIRATDLAELAKILRVRIGYFYGDDDLPSPLADDELAVLRDYRWTPDELKPAARRMLHARGAGAEQAAAGT